MSGFFATYCNGWVHPKIYVIARKAKQSLNSCVSLFTQFSFAIYVRNPYLPNFLSPSPVNIDFRLIIRLYEFAGILCNRKNGTFDPALCSLF
jgi:hypothetical protein